MSVKISELPILDSLADNDVIAGVDTSANVTSKIEMGTLKNYIDTNTQYTAGTNINITDNVISAPFVYDKTQTNALIENLTDETNAQIEELQSEVDSLSTIFNAFPTESGEGESVTLDDTAEVKFKKFDLKGNTSQTTYNGKNLVKVTNGNSSRNNTTLTIQDNVINFKTTGDTTYVAYGIDNTLRYANYGNYVSWGNMTLPAGTYTLSTKYLSGSTTTTGAEGNFIRCVVYGRTVGSTGDVSTELSRILVTNSSNSNTFTTSQDMEVNIVIYMYANQTPTVDINFQVQLESGSSVTEFEPYVGGTASPNPDYPQDVNVVSGDNKIVVNSKNQLETYNISGTFNGVSYTMQDGVLTLNGTCTATSGLTGLGIFRQIKGINYKWTYVYESGSCTDYGGGLFMGATPTSTTSAGYGAGFRASQSRTVGTFNNGEEHTYYLYMALNNSSTFTNYKIKPLIVQGDEYSYDFEPYQGNTYNIDLPVENLFDKSLATTGKGVNVNTGFLYNETATFATDYIEIQNNTAYIPSGYSSSANRVYGAIYDNNKLYLEGISTDIGTKKFTISNANAKYIRLTGFVSEIDTWQLEKGTKQNTFTPYGTTPIELCKIGNYQDYFYKDSGKWYLHKEIGKVILNGSEAWTLDNGTNPFYLANIISKLKAPTTSTVGTALCNKYVSTNIFSANTNKGFIILSDGTRQTNCRVREESMGTVEAFKTSLQNNNAIIYSIIATPTNEEITYQPLIDQLNELEKAISYEGQTNIAQVNNDKPFILDVTAIKSLQSVLDRVELLES